MQVNNFITLLSEERIQTYLNLGFSKPDIVNIYKINLELSAAFYIPLHGIELTLRNKVHNLLTKVKGENWLFSDKILYPDQIKLVEKATNKIRYENKDPIVPRVVANLSLSFWEHLFSPKYEDLWRKHLHQIIEQTSSKLTRKKFHKNLVPIRKLRNRVAHYECILHNPLQEHYETILKCIGWLNPECAEWTRSISKFDEVYGLYKNQIKRG